MELPGGFKNPPDIFTGEYGDPCDTDERYWAAAELYKTFGNAEYREAFEELAKEKSTRATAGQIWEATAIWPISLRTVLPMRI